MSKQSASIWRTRRIRNDCAMMEWRLRTDDAMRFYEIAKRTQTADRLWISLHQGLDELTALRRA